MIVGFILLMLGIIFSFLPHDIHNIVLSGNVVHEHGSHNTHITSGLIVGFLGVIIIVLGWKIF